MVREGSFGQVADWLGSYVIKHHPAKEARREAWLQDPDPWAGRAGWGLTAERIAKSPDGIDVDARHRHRRGIGGVSGLSGVEGLHVALCADLDWRDGAAGGSRLNTLPPAAQD